MKISLPFRSKKAADALSYGPPAYARVVDETGAPVTDMHGVPDDDFSLFVGAEPPPLKPLEVSALTEPTQEEDASKLTPPETTTPRKAPELESLLHAPLLKAKQSKPAGAVSQVLPPTSAPAPAPGKQHEGERGAAPESAESVTEFVLTPESDKPAGPKVKKSIFSKFLKKAKVPPTSKEDVAKKKRLTLPKHTVLPIRVVVGFLPEVSLRDVREYAMGVADKHFDQAGMAYFDAVEYENGYAYEVHEGGEGKSYLPSILQFFKSQSPYNPDKEVFAVIQTATRKVQVLQLREGLAGLILPENSDLPESEWLIASKPLSPALNRQRGLLVAGVAVFASGLLAMMSTAAFFRLQGYLPAEPLKIELISTASLPRSQWPRLESALQRGEAIKAMRFKADKWAELELFPAEAPASLPEPVDAAAPAQLAPQSAALQLLPLTGGTPAGPGLIPPSNLQKVTP